MTTTDRDAQALTYLARRLREETPGANRWDEPGIHAVVAGFIGQNLASTVERVTRHAADPQAKTPGAIRRPFLPDAQAPGRPLEHLKPEDRCKTCGKSNHDCRRNPHAGHDFEPDFKHAREADVAPVIAELKGLARPDAVSAEAARVMLHNTTQGIA